MSVKKIARLRIARKYLSLFILAPKKMFLFILFFPFASVNSVILRDLAGEAVGLGDLEAGHVRCDNQFFLMA